ncbi:hypothetical protein HG531_005447 [Fusarium graminearum]|nr:hypothetical protein HG531_005447 [Fusarium graminearum]
MSSLLQSRGHERFSALRGVQTLASRLRSVTKPRLQVGIAEHSTAMSLKVLENGNESLGAEIASIVEQDISVPVEGSIGLLEKPSQVLVLLADSPGQAGMILLNGSKDVLGDVAQPSRLGDVQGSKRSNSSLLASRQDNGQTLHSIVVVGIKFLILQLVDKAVDGSLGVHTLAVADQSFLKLGHVLDLTERRNLADLVSSADESSGTGVGKKFLLKITGINDLQWLKSASKLGRCDIGVDIEEMTILGFGHRSEDGDIAGLNRVLNSLLVDLCDLSDVLPLVLVEIIGDKSATDRSGCDSKLVEAIDKLQVLFKE